MTLIVLVFVTVVIFIIGEFIKLLLTLNDCYKFILVTVIVVIKGKRKHSKPSGDDDTTINGNEYLHSIFHHFIQKVNEIWYPGRAAIIHLLGYHISLASCTK